MTGKFQIDGRHKIKSIRAGLPFFVVAPIGIVFGYFSEMAGPNSVPLLLTVFGLYGLLIFSPAIYLHIIYSMDNEGTILNVDKEKNEIMIKTKSGEFKYKHEDIRKSELNRVNRTDAMTWSMPWTTYGYLKLGFNDGREFFLTSLMLDLDNMPFAVKTTRLRYIPYLDTNQIEYKDIKAHNEKLRREKIAEYEEGFKNLPDDKLQEKISTPTKFEFEARKAAENILERRRKITTANKVFMSAWAPCAASTFSSIILAL